MHVCGLEETFDMEHNLVDTPLGGCRDMFVHEGFPSLVRNAIIPNFPKHSHVSPALSQPSSSPELDFDVPNDNF